MTKLIERNTTIPARREEIFSTAADNQTAVDIVVLQGERELSADNRVLGRFRLDGIPPAPRGIPQIKVSFDIDANGILSVTARGQGTGKEQKVTITESTRLERDEIDRMVRDAEQHAEEDRQRRESIESRNQLDSLVLQLERVLVDLGDKVPANEKARWQEGQNYQPPPGWEFQHGQGPRSFGGGEGFDETGFSDFFESLFGGGQRGNFYLRIEV